MKDIEVRSSAADHIRLRPAMYLGSTDIVGLNNVLKWIKEDNPAVYISIKKDKLDILSDEILLPTKPHKCVESAFTEIATGGPDIAYFAVLCAVSEQLIFESENVRITFEKGVAKKTEEIEYFKGTKISVKPDPEIFGCLNLLDNEEI